MSIRVSVAIALPQRQEVIEVELPEGSTAQDAVRAARLDPRFPGAEVDASRLGLWSKPCEPSARLREGDRVEVYRALRADAKAMRRSRARINPSTRSRSGP